ncbi:hypothetical protein QJS10_CPA09g01042 [Acorus calamus]|uniref:Uncharacterized protein n=1 Tax=Acorus calamus TaxID=4465 RepID=A0AAV9E939_ACOCL|nr:hypothetical protein QJS10_CPA09g01042 [Acorus calamus]
MALVHTDSFLDQPDKGRTRLVTMTMQKSKLMSIVVSQWENWAGPSFATLEMELASFEVASSPEAVPSVLIPLLTAEQPKAIQGDMWKADGLHLVQILMASRAPTVFDTQHQGESSPPMAFESGEMEFLGSLTFIKASQIGMIFENEHDKFQFKSFFHKSMLASSTILPLGNKLQDHS